jgi:hypothetical protein
MMMNSISLPNVNATLNSIPSPTIGERRVLLCGQHDGTITGTTTTENVHLLTNTAIEGYFGSTSILTKTIKRFLEASDFQCPVDVLSVDEPTSGTLAAAVATVTFSESPTVAGTVRLNVVSKTDYTATTDVTTSSTVTEIATALYTVLDSISNKPFIVTDGADGESPGTLTLTATEKGTVGDNFAVSVEDIPAGLTVSVAGFDDGEGTISVSDIFDDFPDTRYTGILWPVDWYSSLSEAQTFLADRYNASNDILDGVVVTTKVDSSGDLVDAVASLNDRNVTLIGLPEPSNANVKGCAVTYFPDFVSAEVLAYRDTRLTLNANIADIVATNKTLDQVGGMSLASLPYFNTPMQFTPQPSDKNAMFTYTQMTALTNAGVTVIGKNRQNTAMLLGFTVTTYNTNTQGNTDVTFKYLNYVDTASVIREYIFNNLKADFVQSRLTDGALRPGRSFANGQSIRAAVKRYLSVLADSDLYGSLVQSGGQAQRFIDKYLTVTTDLPNRTVTIGAQVPIVGQLGTINFPITITTTIGS